MSDYEKRKCDPNMDADAWLDIGTLVSRAPLRIVRGMALRYRTSPPHPIRAVWSPYPPDWSTLEEGAMSLAASFARTGCTFLK